jgi:Spectrin-binding region of Ca2+-Calmodulin
MALQTIKFSFKLTVRTICNFS